MYKGTSIRYFASKFWNPESQFYGFNSFEGLPEAWANKTAGAFTRFGELPAMDDVRISLVKGWFQDTLPSFAIDASKFAAILVHMDADLYSSTLFVLSQLWQRLNSYYLLFDEFMNDEARALYNFLEAFPSQVEFLAHDDSINPQRVLCKISRIKVAL